MARVTIRFEDALYERIVFGAQSSGTNVAAYIRGIVDRFDGLDPGGYHDRFDEIHATLIQTFAVIAASVSARNPDLLARGMRDARILLQERGLLDPEQDRA